MAARGGPKYKEYRVPITSVRHWLKEIEYDGLIVCEIYGTAFGACQVILPTINTIMLSIDDSEEKVKWITINVAKLEEDQRQLLSEEEKKKREAESQMRRRSSTMVSTEDGKEETPNTAREHTSDHLLSLVEEDELKSKSGWDKVTIPKLEKYSGYDHPRPLWLMIKDGQVTHELTTANPPKMQRLVTSIVNGIPLTEQELWAMDMHPETDPAKKKKRKVPEKKKEKKKKVKVQKVETVIPPEFILSCRITDLKKSDWDSKRAPLIALYTKDGSAIDFSYHSQTERVRDDHDPIFYKNFSFLKSDDLDQELKFVIYDAESDDIKREHPPVLGEAYAHLKTLLGQEEGTQDLKLVTEDGTEIEKSILSVSIKTRAQPGIVTDWKFTVSCSKLPGLEGNPNKIDPVVQLSVQDVNTQRFGYVSETERLRSTPDPTFSTRLTIAHHSRDDRLLRFTVYDVDEYDILNEKKGMIGVATIRFETFLAQRKLTKDKTVTLPLVDVDSKQVGDAIITLAAEEIGGTGEDDEDELETNASGQIGNEEKKEATNVVEKVEVAFAIREFVPRDGGNDPLIAIYRKALTAPDAPYEYMGQTERVKIDTNPKFDKVFLLDRPSTASNVSHEYRFVVYDADNDVDLSSAIVMAETALDFAGTNVDAGLIELGVINAQGQPIERTVFTLTMKPVGSITSTPFAIMCGDLPSSARGKCDSMVMLYSKNLTNGKYSFVGSTESVPNSTDPIFTKNLIIDRYSAVNRELRACVWDVESDGETVVEKEMLGECFFRVEDIVKQAEVMTQVELKLTKNDRPSNDGKSFLRLQPLIKPVARPGSAGVVAPEEEKETSVELTQEEKEAGTSPATADGSKVAVHVAVKDINKRDWVGPLAPLIAVYKKNPATGKFDFIDQTERVKDESSISFSRTFLLDNPTGSQFYRLALMDATANDANVTLKGRYSRDTQMLGELVIDLRDLISTGTMDYRMVDRENKEVEKTRVAVSVKLVGVVTTTSVNVAAVDLPRSELFAKCDPMAVLFAKNIITGIWQELQRTERQTNHFSPSFKSPFTLTSYSRMDTTLRVSLYDVDYPDLPLSDKDLLGEMEFSCDTYLAGPRIGTYQLLKNGVHVNDGKAMLHLTNTAKPEPTPVEEKKEVVSEKSSSKPVSKPSSAARQRPTPAADKLAEIEAKEPIVADPVVVDDEDEKKVEPVTSTPAVIPAPAAVESKEEKEDDKKEDETSKQDDSKEEEEEAKEKEVEKTTTSGPEPTPVSDAEAAAAVERAPAE